VEEKRDPTVVLITGMSGAGRTEAMHTFEDLGYFCIDNLPPSLLISLVTLAGLNSDGKRKLAVVCDIRAMEFFSALTDELAHIRDAGISVAVLYLDSADDVLLRRYKTSRRRHPLSGEGMTVTEGIYRERKLLAGVRELADYVLDTSAIEPRELRRSIRRLFDYNNEQSKMEVNVQSFGFKYGPELEADLVMDVRFLPNPYWNEQLRTKTGLDDEVRRFVLGKPEAEHFLQAWKAMLEVLMPGYLAEGKNSLMICVGCTGGQHRSVVLAEATAQILRQSGYQVAVSHRDLPLAEVI